VAVHGRWISARRPGTGRGSEGKDPQRPTPCSPQVAHAFVMSRPQARSRGGGRPGRIRAPLSDSGDCKGRDRGGGRGPCPERLARARRDGRRGGAWGELPKPLPFSCLHAPLRAGDWRARAPRSQTLGPGRAGVISRPERSGGRANRAEGSARSGGGRRGRRSASRDPRPPAGRWAPLSAPAPKAQRGLRRRPGPHGWGVQSAVLGSLRVGRAVEARDAASRRGGGRVAGAVVTTGGRRAACGAGSSTPRDSGPSARSPVQTRRFQISGSRDW
jgi:hypothetical protein